MPEITEQQLDRIGIPPGGESPARTTPTPEEEDGNIRAAQQKISEEIRRLRLQNDDYANDIKARRRYARRLFRLIVWWVVAILIILVLQGFCGPDATRLEATIHDWPFRLVIHFNLPENIILALIGGTTASVIGLFHIVAIHFFPPPK